jgi:DnaJ-class molecular chaperone
MKNTPTISVENKTYVPKGIAQKCPVCNSFGTLKYGTVTCHACKGKGYILIPVKEEDEKT